MSEHPDVGTRVALALSELSPSADLSGRIAERTTARAERRRALATGVALFAVVAVLGSLVALAGSRPDRGRDDVVADDLSASFRWDRLPAAPIPLRSNAGVAWTGTGVFVWGGGSGSSNRSNLRSDGAIFDPSTGRWRVLPPAPIGARSSPLTAWTGAEVIVWGGFRPDGNGEPTWSDGAAYNPASDTWRRVALAPVEDYEAWAWTGRELIVLGRLPTESGTAIAAYDPAGDRWRMLPGLGFMSNTGGWAEWTGEDVLYWRPGIEPRLFAYNPANDAWREIAVPTDDFRLVWSRVVLAWTGTQLVVASGEYLDGDDERRSRVEAVAYDPDHDSWQRVVPTQVVDDNALVRPTSTGVWNGHEMVVFSLLIGEDVSVLDPTTGAWSTGPAPPGDTFWSSLVATDDGDTYVFGEEMFARLVRESPAR